MYQYIYSILTFLYFKFSMLEHWFDQCFLFGHKNAMLTILMRNIYPAKNTLTISKITDGHTITKQERSYKLGANITLPLYSNIMNENLQCIKISSSSTPTCLKTYDANADIIDAKTLIVPPDTNLTIYRSSMFKLDDLSLELSKLKIMAVTYTNNTTKKEQTLCIPKEWMVVNNVLLSYVMVMSMTNDLKKMGQFDSGYLNRTNYALKVLMTDMSIFELNNTQALRVGMKKWTVMTTN